MLVPNALVGFYQFNWVLSDLCKGIKSEKILRHSLSLVYFRVSLCVIE